MRGEKRGERARNIGVKQRWPVAHGNPKTNKAENMVEKSADACLIQMESGESSGRPRLACWSLAGLRCPSDRSRALDNPRGTQLHFR
jgi:hypothetical protein